MGHFEAAGWMRHDRESGKVDNCGAPDSKPPFGILNGIQT